MEAVPGRPVLPERAVEAHRGQGVEAVVDGVTVMAVLRQHPAQQAALLRVIVDDENARVIVSGQRHGTHHWQPGSGPWERGK